MKEILDLILYPEGGRTPIITNDPKDPRLQAYQDSLDLYDASKLDINRLKSATTFEGWLDYTKKFNTLNPNAAPSFENLSLLNGKPPIPTKVQERYFGRNKGTAVEFAKPVQPIVYQPEQSEFITVTDSNGNMVTKRNPLYTTTERVNPVDIRPKEQPINLQQQTTTLQSQTPQLTLQTLPTKEEILRKSGLYFSREKHGQEVGDDVEFFDKKTGRKVMFQEGGISQMGYKDDSPYRNRESIDINTPNGLIDMSEVGIDLMANGRYLPAYSGMHQFNTTKVKEVPIKEYGGFTEQMNSFFS